MNTRGIKALYNSTIVINKVIINITNFVIPTENNNLGGDTFHSFFKYICNLRYTIHNIYIYNTIKNNNNNSQITIKNK